MSLSKRRWKQAQKTVTYDDGADVIHRLGRDGRCACGALEAAGLADAASLNDRPPKADRIDAETAKLLRLIDARRLRRRQEVYQRRDLRRGAATC